MQRPEKDGSGGLNEWQLKKVAKAYDDAESWWDNMRIDERPNLSAYQIATKARQWVRKHGVETIWVDNASEVTVGEEQGERHDLKTAAMVRTLRNVAKTCDVPVVLLVHFKRPKANNAKEPRFIRPTSDLWKNAGAFEEAARVAVGLWLDENSPGGVVGTILKQTEGAKDVDFFMPMHESAGLIQPHGGVVCGETKGYTENEAEAA
jgi:replicative DNA helicase